MKLNKLDEGDACLVEQKTRWSIQLSLLFAGQDFEPSDGGGHLAIGTVPDTKESQEPIFSYRLP